MIPLVKSKATTYFASEQDVKKVVDGFLQAIDDYRKELKSSNRLALLRNSYFTYNSGLILNGRIYASGDQGQFTNYSTNLYSEQVTHVVNLVCQQKLAWTPQATVTDSQSLEQIRLAKGILFQLSNDADVDLDGKLRKATEISYTMGESSVAVLWNPDAGRIIATEADEEGSEYPIHEGENEFIVCSPLDLITDTTCSDTNQQIWKILVKFENKFDLAAIYPAFADKIVGLSMDSMFMRDYTLSYSRAESLLVPKYIAIHKATPALPKGRMTIFLSEDIVLYDGENPYRDGKIPIFRMAGRDLGGTAWGYSRAFDLLPVQQVVNKLASVALTNQLTFGIGNVAAAKGSNLEWTQFYGGLNVIEFDASLGQAAVPQALNLTQTPKEVFEFLNFNVSMLSTMSGISPVSQGNPDTVLKGQVSGAALALMNSTSIQFNSDLQKSYVRLAEQVGTQAVRNIQDFGFLKQDWQRVGMAATATNSYLKRDFGRNDLDKIEKITIRYGNPLSQTQSGRLQIAETMLQNKLITNAKQYLSVIESGDLEPLVHYDESQLLLIRQENEALVSGKTAVAFPYDDHKTHILEHTGILSSIESRMNPRVLQVVQEHIAEHKSVWQMADPTVLQILNIPPAPALKQPSPKPVANSAPPGLPGEAPNDAGVNQKVPIPQAAPIV